MNTIRLKNKVILTNIALMRSILIMSIIIGHAFAIYTNSNAWPLPVGCTQMNMLRWVNPVCISIALQAFVFVSGYLFAYKTEDNNPYDVTRFIIGKFKRIYLPSIIFSLIYISFFGCNSDNLLECIYEVINGAGHLWFLPMLFWCYTFGVVLYKHVEKPSIGLMVLFLCLSLASIFIPNVLRIADAIHYFLYYVLGIWAFHNRLMLADKLSKTNALAIGWLVILALLFAKAFFANMTHAQFPYLTIARIVINILLGTIGSLILWLSATKITNRYPNINIGRTDIWYGMYIYHQFIMMYAYYHTSLACWTGNLLPYLTLCITIFVSYMLVTATLKTRIGRWLIG